MNDVTKCPRCGADQPVGSTGGVCPRCAAELLQATQTDIPGEGTGSFTPPTVEELAAKFPQLEILGLIGRGGMGAVYKARQKELDRLVALKILPPDIGRDAAFAERFTREARALAKLNHPGIVTIYDFGRADGLYFFLMEFVDGMNLRELLHRQRISSREALAIVPQICDALQFAHDQGIVHRDIKPENLLIDRRGRVKVADFGLAKLIGTEPDPASPADSPAGSPTLTEAGKVMGTPNYMSPEQLEHPEEVDHRADIYALGVVFYQMLTGELPEKQLQPPSRKVQIDVRLDEVVLRALEKQPDRRYQQASTMKLQVETIAQAPAGAEPSFATRVNQGVDYKTKATLFGLPWLHVATGQDPLTGRVRIARGIFAIGGVAQGVVACGGVAMGGITLGGLSLGIFSYGGMAVGLLAFGGLGVGLLGACGGLAVAPVALGAEAIGWLAAGAKAIGTHVLDVTGSDEVARNFFNPWSGSFLKNAYIANYFLVVLTVFLASGVPMWLAWRSRARTPGGNRIPNQPLPAGTVEAWLALMDQGDYAGNWAAASVYFQRVMGREKWTSLGKTIRSPLGRVISRQLTTTRYKYLGTRVEVKYNTVFEGLAAAVETVTFMREPNGEWKSIGYLIRPAGFAESTEGDRQHFRLRKSWWMVAAIVILALVVLFRPVAERDGRWHSQRISQGTTSILNPLASLRVTEVKRFKSIVVFRVVSDIGFPPHLLTAEFNGEDLTNLPMTYGSYEYTGPKLNCLLGPDHTRVGYGDGTSFVGNDLDGWLESVQPRPGVIVEPKPTGRHRHIGNPQYGPGEVLYGFYLPDEETAEMVVRQGGEILAGRTNYLGDGVSTLLLFDLKRFARLPNHTEKTWDHLTGSLRVAPDFDVTFGPVHEQILPWDGHQSPCLSLITGQLEPLPANASRWPAPPDLPAGVSMVLRNGVVDPDNTKWIYASGGTDLRMLSNEQWPDVVAAQVLTIASTMTNPPPPRLNGCYFPETFVFKTRRGAAGVLQVAGYTNDSTGVVMRYKLVQSTGIMEDKAGTKNVPPPPHQAIGHDPRRLAEEATIKATNLIRSQADRARKQELLRLSLAMVVLTAVAVAAAVAGWRLGRKQGFSRPFPLTSIRLAVIGSLLLLLILGSVWLQVQPGRNQGNTITLADQPFELKKRPTPEVIQAGLSKPAAPWAWQELQARLNTGDFTPAEANQLMTSLTTWLRQEYPHGYDQPLDWMGTLLDDLKARQLVTETNALTLLDAYAGSPWLDALPRLREQEPTLQITCHLRSPWNNGLFGYRLLNEMREFAIDGQPVVEDESFGRGWDQQEYMGEIKLPGLLPGKHILTCEAQCAWVDDNTLEGLAPGAPATDWPPALFKKTTPLHADFIVYAKDEVMVGLSDDPALDPVAAGVFSIKQVIIRPQGGHLKAFVSLNVAQHPSVPVSVKVTLELAGQVVPCGSIWAEREASGTHAQSMDERGGDVGSLDQQIKEADVVLKPNPQAVESRPGIDRIWGKDIRFSHVPLARLDLPQDNPGH